MSAQVASELVRQAQEADLRHKLGRARRLIEDGCELLAGHRQLDPNDPALKVWRREAGEWLRERRAE